MAGHSEQRQKHPLPTAVYRCEDRPVPSVSNLSISITLSATQVDDVVRAASQSRASSLTALISSALAEPAGAMALGAGGPSGNGHAPDPRRTAVQSSDRRLSRSLLRGLAILSCFTVEQPERGVLELARELSLSASTTHRYVLTLLEVGLLERSPRSRRYRLPRPELGPQAAGVG